MTDREKLAALKARIDKHLNCTLEHLDGVHEGKIVVDRETFESAYEAASALSRLIDGLPEESDGFDYTKQYDDGHNALLQTVTDLILGKKE